MLAAVAHQRGLDPGDVEVGFGDEARIGQKNKLTRRWARRGTRPAAPRDQRTASTYIFGAICPREGKAAGLILPWCNTEAMDLHLAAISADVALGRHAVLLVDQAGWHLSTRLAVPDNITIAPLPAKCPELNPQETSGHDAAGGDRLAGPAARAAAALGYADRQPGPPTPVCEAGRCGGKR